MNFEEMQLEIFLLRDFLLIYTKFEKMMRLKFLDSIKLSNEENKYRLYYYLGWKNKINFIDYDTFETKTQSIKFDSTKAISSMSLNDMIKLNRKEHFLENEKLSVPSKNSKMVDLTFNDHIKKVIDMRNIIAHEYSEAKLSDKYVVEVLNKKLVQQELRVFYEQFKEKIDLNNLTEKSIHIFSNILYLKNLTDILEKIDK